MLTSILLTTAFLSVAIASFILGRESGKDIGSLSDKERATLIRRLKGVITISDAARLMAYASNGVQQQKRRAAKAAAKGNAA